MLFMCGWGLVEAAVPGELERRGRTHSPTMLRFRQEGGRLPRRRTWQAVLHAAFGVSPRQHSEN